MPGRKETAALAPAHAHPILLTSAAAVRMYVKKEKKAGFSALALRTAAASLPRLGGGGQGGGGAGILNPTSC